MFVATTLVAVRQRSATCVENIGRQYTVLLEITFIEWYLDV